MEQIFLENLPSEDYGPYRQQAGRHTSAVFEQHYVLHVSRTLTV